MAPSMGASPPTTKGRVARQRAVSVGRTGPHHLVSKTSQLPSVNARRLIKTKPSVPTSDANRRFQATTASQLPSASARCPIKTKSFAPTSDASPGFHTTTTLQLPSVNALWLTKTNALGRVVARVVVGY